METAPTPSAENRPTPPPARRAPGGPPVRLGAVSPRGISPGVCGLIRDGVHHNPGLATRMRGSAELRVEGGADPVVVSFGGDAIHVFDRPRRGHHEDSDAAAPSVQAPDVVIEGRLPDVVQMITVPHLAGFPNPLRPRGRRALGRLWRGGVQVTGDRAFARELLQLLTVDG